MNTKEVGLLVDTINNFIQLESWFDFEIVKYDKNELVIGGSKSLSYPHDLEILFKDVSFISTPMEWKTDISKKALIILEGEEAYKINFKFQVEQGYFIFKFVPEDYPNDFICVIGAKRLEFKYKE